MKHHLIRFLTVALLLLPLSAAANGSTTYYSKVTATAETGHGLVYASKTEVTPTDANFTSNTASVELEGESAEQTAYIYAKALKEGEEFLYWTDAYGKTYPGPAVKVTGTESTAKEYTFTAVFGEPNAVKVANDASGCTVKIDKIQNKIGDEVTIEAIAPYNISTTSIFPANTVPNRAYKFLGWYDENDELFSSEAICKFVADKKYTLTAKFELTPAITKAAGYYRVKSGWNATLRVSGNFSIDVTGQEQFYGDLDLIRNPEGYGYGYSNHKTNCRYNGDPHENIYSDAGTVMYVAGTLNQSNVNSYTSGKDVLTNVELIGQGVNAKTFLSNKTPKIKWHKNLGYYTVYISGAALKFQENASRWNGGDVLYPGRDDDSSQTMLHFEPIDEDHADEYWFGMFPEETMYFDEGYWTSLYTAFPYKCYGEDGIEVYIIKSIEQDGGREEAILHKIESGVVPANTAVLLKCPTVINTDEYVNIAQGKAKMPKPANRLIPLLPDDDTIDETEYEGNLLNGEFQLNSAYPDKNDPNKDLGHKKFDGSCMRVLGKNADGHLAFVSMSPDEELKPNKAWLDVSSHIEPSEGYKLAFFSDPSTEIEDVIFDDSDRDNSRSAIYDLQGRKVTAPVKGRIYIVNGKKVIY